MRYTFILKYITSVEPDIEGECTIRSDGDNPVEAIMKLITVNSFPTKTGTFAQITSIVIQSYW